MQNVINVIMDNHKNLCYINPRYTFSKVFTQNKFVSDIAVFVLKRDVKLQLTN